MTYHLSKLRKTPIIRDLLAECTLSLNDFVMPLFISEKIDAPLPIASMPGIAQLPLNALLAEIESLVQLGVKAVILFGIPSEKDPFASSILNDNGIIQQAIQRIKTHYPSLLVIADVCMCEYTSHGHCGILKEDNTIHHQPTLSHIAQQSLSFAKAGVDWIAPSGMVDGMVRHIREALDSHHFTDIGILSYAVKYSSHLYGPFRDAAEGSPEFGDRRGYQMDYRNYSEAEREARIDIEEGADLIMVKPAGMYLDIIKTLHDTFPSIPMVAYQVSGEYSMIKCGAKQGLFDEKSLMIESLTAIKRAGATLIISYFTKQFAQMINKI